MTRFRPIPARKKTHMNDIDLAPVALYIVGGSGTSNMTQNIELASLQAGGWPRFVEQDLLPEIERGGWKRVWLKLPSGTQRFSELPATADENQMQFTAMQTAFEQGKAWIYAGIVEALAPVRSLLESRGGELGVYMGALQCDIRLKKLRPALDAMFYQDQVARESPLINMAAIYAQRELHAFTCMGIDSVHNLPTRLFRDMDAPERMLPLKQWPVRVTDKISHTLKRGGRNKRGRCYVETWPNSADESWFIGDGLRMPDHGVYVSNAQPVVWCRQWPKDWALSADIVARAQRAVIVETAVHAGELAARAECHEGLQPLAAATWKNQEKWIREYALWMRARNWAITVNPWDMRAIGVRNRDFE